jgi:hypothetical protein
MSWPTSLSDYNNMFHSDGVPLPDIHSNFQPKTGNEGWFEDSFFANLRTAGVNPMVIARVSSIPDAFTDMTEIQYKAACRSGVWTRYINYCCYRRSPVLL